VVAGTPEKVAAHKGSATGEYLARVLRGEPLIPLEAVSFADARNGSAANGRSNGKRPRAAIKVEAATPAIRR
jgi:hypothetical protein